MAKKKAEMENEYNLYEACIHDAKELANQGLYAAALKKSMEALEYYQSQNMSEEDEEYIEQVYNSVEDEEHDELPE